MLYLLFHFLSLEGNSLEKNKKERKKVKPKSSTAERVTKQPWWLNEATPGSGAQCQSSAFYSVILYQEHKENILFALHYFFCNFTQGKRSVKQKSISTSVERYFLSIVPAKENKQEDKTIKCCWQSLFCNCKSCIYRHRGPGLHLYFSSLKVRLITIRASQLVQW